VTNRPDSCPRCDLADSDLVDVVDERGRTFHVCPFCAHELAIGPVPVDGVAAGTLRALCQFWLTTPTPAGREASRRRGWRSTPPTRQEASRAFDDASWRRTVAAMTYRVASFADVKTSAMRTVPNSPDAAPQLHKVALRDVASGAEASA